MIKNKITFTIGWDNLYCDRDDVKKAIFKYFAKGAIFEVGISNDSDQYWKFNRTFHDSYYLATCPDPVEGKGNHQIGSIYIRGIKNSRKFMVTLYTVCTGLPKTITAPLMCPPIWEPDGLQELDIKIINHSNTIKC